MADKTTTTTAKGKEAAPAVKAEPKTAPAKEEAVKKEVKAAPVKNEPVKAEVKPEPAKNESAKAEAKAAPAKKTTVKKAAAKKAPAKKAAEVKTETEPKKTAAKVPTAVKNAGVYVQFDNKENELEALKSRIVEKWCADEGRKPSAIKEMNIYIKPEDNAAYYVINGQGSSIEL